MRSASTQSIQPASRPFGGVFAGKRVLVTGHTGFKGSWLCEWLLQLGAEVSGFALPPSTSPSLFEQLKLASRLRHIVGDVRDLAAVRQVVFATQPDFVFHLAAQPLVRLSYEQPVETYATNVMGTAHVLEALRALKQPCMAVIVTTDKCYENKEWVHSYREEDPMGGYDPYSSSKGAAELVTSAYRRSFFSGPDSPVRIASARAGNVIGGGDWALDRIVPDCIRSLRDGRSIPVRNKVATRPWQHVLEPLSGYLWLAACLHKPELSAISGQRSAAKPSDSQVQALPKRSGEGGSTLSSQLASAFNFGPALTSNRTVAELVQEILKHWPGDWQDHSDPNAVHEAKLLNLATDKAYHILGWKPVWSFESTIAETVSWYRRAEAAATDAHALTSAQITAYESAATAARLPWALSS